MVEWRYANVLDLGKIWSGELHAPAALPPNLLDRRLTGTGHYSEERNLAAA
jgi:hypothetical protein